MDSKADQLATRFEQETEAFVAGVQALSDDAWGATTGEEGWTVAAAVHHIASSPPALVSMVQAAGTGGVMPAITPEGLDELNAADASQFSACSRAEAIALLRANTAAAAAVVRGLSDAQLDRTDTLPFGMRMTAGEMVSEVLIGHMAGHRASIDATAA